VIKMLRKRILIEGDVQDVAYRIFVRKVAKALNVKGLVRNLPDGNVEVLCETDEKVLKKFLGALKSCRYDGMQNAGRVSNIEVFDQKQKARPFKSFEIDYGHKVKGLAKEEIHRQELMVYHGSELRSEMRSGFDKLGTKIDRVGQNVNDVGQKVDVVGKNVVGVGQDVQAMHNDMNERFTELDGKYHVISEALLAHTKALEALVEDYIAEKRKHTDKGES
jgi:acylphosphatase